MRRGQRVAQRPAGGAEGIRKGADDYAYAYTLRTIARPAGDRGKAAFRRLDELMSAVPIRRAAGNFTTADMQRLRERLAHEIEMLVAR